MNIVLRTGFEKISHSLNLRPQSEPKGAALLKVGHVVQVEELRQPGQDTIIKCKVVRQATVSETPYEVKIYLDPQRVVKDVSYTCVYNQSKNCKHVFALIAFINTEESLSKTNNEQTWGRPSMREYGKDKYSKGKYMIEMRPPKKKLKASEPIVRNLLDPSILSERGLVEPSALRLVAEKMQQDSAELAAEVRALNEKRLSEKKALQLAHQENCMDAIVSLPINFDDYVIFSNASIHVSDQKYLDYYYKKIYLDDDVIMKLCKETIEQSKCKEWFEARRLRITGSQDVHCIKTRRTKSIASLVQDIINPKKFSVGSTQYGTKKEPLARKEYMKMFNVEVIEVGLFVSKYQPWLCISMDGVVFENGKVSKLLEIKCPSTLKKLPVIDWSKKISNMKYLKLDNSGNVTLDENNVYYTQIQVMLYVTGLQKCDLFVYTPVKNGSLRLTISKNDQFLKLVIPKCEEFYFSNVLPQLYLEDDQNQ